jgi:hypothetical protein
MPTVLQYRGFRFFFYANEGVPRERMHVHVRKGSLEAKLWMEPEVSVAYNYGYDARTLHELILVAASHRDLIERTWNDFFRT